MDECRVTLDFWRTDKFVLRGPDWYSWPVNNSPFRSIPFGPYLFKIEDQHGHSGFLPCVRNAEGLSALEGRVLPQEDIPSF